MDHIHRQKRNRRIKRVASNTPKNCRNSYLKTLAEPFACRWGTWSLTATRFFLCALPVGLLLVPCAHQHQLLAFRQFLGVFDSMSLVLSVGYPFVDECSPCLLLSVVYRILLAFIANMWTSGPISRWYSNPANRLYSNTSSETRTSDSRLYGYKDQGGMFYLEKCKVLIVTRRHTPLRL